MSIQVCCDRCGAVATLKEGEYLADIGWKWLNMTDDQRDYPKNPKHICPKCISEVEAFLTKAEPRLIAMGDGKFQEFHFLPKGMTVEKIMELERVRAAMVKFCAALAEEIKL